MSVPVYPQGVSALAMETVVFVPTLADPTAATVAELTGAGAINLSCRIRTFNSTTTQSKTKKYRHCSKQGTDVLGRVEVEIDAINFLDDPQADPEDAGWEHKALTAGTRGFIVRRRGLASNVEDYVEFAAGQKYKAYPVEWGVQNDVAVNAEEEGQELEYTQELAVKGDVIEGVVAGA